MPKGALKGWEAFDRIEPIGEQWLQTSQISYWVKHIADIQLSKCGGRVNQLKPDDFMPPRFDRPPKTIPKPPTKEESVSMLDALQVSLGFKKDE